MSKQYIFVKRISSLIICSCIFSIIISCSTESTVNSVTPPKTKTFKNEPDGFRGIKWGDSITNYQNMKYDPKDFPSNWFLGKGAIGTKWSKDKRVNEDTTHRTHPILGNLKSYYRRQDDSNIGGFEISKKSDYSGINGPENLHLRYWFYNGKFFFAKMILKGKKDEIIAMLEERYGPSTHKFPGATGGSYAPGDFVWNETDDILNLMRGIIDPTYIWEGEKSYISYSSGLYLTYMSKEIRYQIRDDKNKLLKQILDEEMAVKELGKGKGF